MAIFAPSFVVVALSLLLFLFLLPSTFASKATSGYSAEDEDQSIVTIFDEYPKPENPKAFATSKKQKVVGQGHGSESRCADYGVATLLGR